MDTEVCSVYKWCVELQRNDLCQIYYIEISVLTILLFPVKEVVKKYLQCTLLVALAC